MSIHFCPRYQDIESEDLKDVLTQDSPQRDTEAVLQAIFQKFSALKNTDMTYCRQQKRGAEKSVPLKTGAS